MRYATVASGIEATTLAWSGLGWTSAFFSEIDKSCCRFLAEKYPSVPNRGDMTKWRDWPDESIDLLAGGTPCQDFSIAGKRAGMDGGRGQLSRVFIQILERYRPRWVVWENVPGVLSSNGGRDFGTFLGALAECGYGFAYRILDAQHFGVPQRRRRVFVVGYFGDWRRPAAVLFERQSLCGHSAPRRPAGQGVVAGVAGCLGGGGKRGWADDLDRSGAFVPEVAGTLLGGAAGGHGHGKPNGHDRQTMVVTHPLRAEGADASEDGTGRGTPIIPVAVAVSLRGREGGSMPEIEPSGLCPALRQGQGGSGNPMVLPLVSGAVTSKRAKGGGSRVRRLTPRECERLMGMPDDYTACMGADSPRYRAIGNSIVVPVLRWIGERIVLAMEIG